MGKKTIDQQVTEKAYKDFKKTFDNIMKSKAYLKGEFPKNLPSWFSNPRARSTKAFFDTITGNTLIFPSRDKAELYYPFADNTLMAIEIDLSNKSKSINIASCVVDSWPPDRFSWHYDSREEFKVAFGSRFTEFFRGQFFWPFLIFSGRQWQKDLVLKELETERASKVTKFLEK